MLSRKGEGVGGLKLCRVDTALRLAAGGFAGDVDLASLGMESVAIRLSASMCRVDTLQVFAVLGYLDPSTQSRSERKLIAAR
ncbi:hypothetical protein PT2222_20086 [Paraburkholderia tropica]